MSLLHLGNGILVFLPKSMVASSMSLLAALSLGFARSLSLKLLFHLLYSCLNLIGIQGLTYNMLEVLSSR